MARKLIAIASVLSCLVSAVSAEVIDRVVAFVDNEAITLSELKDMHEKMQTLSRDITLREVLTTMINRALLIREARDLGLEASDEDALIEEYIDLKFRTVIKIRDSEIREAYKENRAEFRDRPYDEVKDSIEAYLLEKEINYRLRRHLEDLKENAFIKILLEE